MPDHDLTTTTPHRTRLEHHANGPRLYVAGLRLHHGLTGLALFALGLAGHKTRLAVCGIALCAHDLHDFPWPIHDRPEVHA